MCNKVTLRPEHSDQLLLVIRGKSGVGKGQVIKAISRASDIIGKSDSIFITIPTEAAANNISESTLYTALEIDIQKTKETVKGQQKIEKIWSNKIAVVVDKMSIVSLDPFRTVDLYLGNSKALHKNSSIVLNRLLVVIYLGDYFYYSLIIERSL